MLGRLRTLVLGAAAAMSAACGAPSSFDGLTGGSKVDASLDAPRPISPLSVTMVSTSRPRMKWELVGKEIGAIVELCKTRDFAPGTVKAYESDGRELVIPEDLEPGIWFWRLKARATGAVGTATSVTWEVLVRGPSAHGSSDVPYGSIADVDGDGRPDLITVGDSQMMQGDPYPMSAVLVFTGAADAPVSVEQPQMRGAYSLNTTRVTDFMPVVAGIDFDGDGYADMAYSGLDANLEQGGYKSYSTFAEAGGKWDPQTMSALWMSRMPLYPLDMPMLAAGGDVNGDGYGDLLGSDSATALVNFGGKQGPMAFTLLATSYANMNSQSDAGSAARLLHGAFDTNGDGLSDLVFGPATPIVTPGTTTKQLGTSASKLPAGDAAGPDMMDPPTAILALGADSLDIASPKLLSLANASDVKAKAFTSGDFDGDGITDLAATVPVDGAIRVCVFYGHKDKGLVPGPCAAGLAGDTELGASLTAADLEGDGKDEILATVKNDGASEVRAIRIGEADVQVAPIGNRGYGSHLTTMWPGRPGKARWAAIGDDGESIGIFDGGGLAQAVKKPRFIKENFGRALR